MSLRCGIPIQSFMIVHIMTWISYDPMTCWCEPEHCFPQGGQFGTQTSSTTEAVAEDEIRALAEAQLQV